MVWKRLLARIRPPPPVGELESFLEVVEGSFHRGDIEAFHRVLSRLRWLCRANGFLCELLVIICKCLHSDNPVAVDGCLQILETIIRKHSPALGIFEIHRVARAVALMSADPELEARGYRLLVSLRQIDKESLFNALRRLQVSEDERVRERANAAFEGMLSV